MRWPRRQSAIHPSQYESLRVMAACLYPLAQPIGDAFEGVAGGGDGEAHRVVVGGADEFGPLMRRQLAGGEESVADVGNDDRVVVDLLVEAVHDAADDERGVGIELEGRAWRIELGGDRSL